MFGQECVVLEFGYLDRSLQRRLRRLPCGNTPATSTERYSGPGGGFCTQVHAISSRKPSAKYFYEYWTALENVSHRKQCCHHERACCFYTILWHECIRVRGNYPTLRVGLCQTQWWTDWVYKGFSFGAYVYKSADWRQNINFCHPHHQTSHSIECNFHTTHHPQLTWSLEKSSSITQFFRECTLCERLTQSNVVFCPNSTEY